jgi:hypothetical protein
MDVASAVNVRMKIKTLSGHQLSGNFKRFFLWLTGGNEMNDLYQPCPCGSGKKSKFCCYPRFHKLLRGSPTKVLHQASTFKLHRCLICEESRNEGLKIIFVIRLLPNQRFLFASYVVDTYCMGLKDTLCRIDTNHWEIEKSLEFIPATWTDFDYASARNLILGAIDYAAKFGFEPYEDWAESKYVIEFDRPYEKKYEFGRDGKPLYVQSPNDDPQRIIRQLNQATGGSFHYILAPDDFYDSVTEDYDDSRLSKSTGPRRIS